MSHELTMRANGAAEMAYVGAKPWHGLGQRLEPGATIEVWKQAAGMAWHVRRAIVRYFADSLGAELMTASDRNVLFRSDTLAPIGHVSPDYAIVQPGEILEFFRDLVSDSGYALESAGTLFGGRKFWALAKVSEDTVRGDDTVGGYLLLCTSTDGTMATEARETTVRVVCNNTLRMARADGQSGASPVIKVAHRTKFDATAVKARLGMSGANFAATMEIARQLAQVRVTDAGAQDYVRRLLRPEEAAKADAKRAAEMVAAAPAGSSEDFAALLARPHVSAPVVVSIDDGKRAPKGEKQILELFRRTATGGGLPGTEGTAWGLVNAVTEYVDHSATAQSADHRAASAWFGKGDELKTEALAAALALR